MLVVGDIILAARDEHASFTRERHSQRSCVAYLSERHRVYYKELADQLKDRLSVARQFASVIGGSLVGVDADGNPFAVEILPSGGAALFVGSDTVPYVGDSSTDPFGSSTTGFVLPSDSLQIIAIWAELSGGMRMPVSWEQQGSYAKFPASERGLLATVNHFRLTPLRNPTTVQSAWDDVQSLTVAYVPEPPEFDDLDPATLEQEISIPTVYGHVLKWELAAWMARREMAVDEKFPPGLAQFFLGEVRDQRASTKEAVQLDHRPVKVHRMGRNR